ARLVPRLVAVRPRHAAARRGGAGARTLERGPMGRLAPGAARPRPAPGGHPRALLPHAMGGATPARRPRVVGAARELADLGQRPGPRKPSGVYRGRPEPTLDVHRAYERHDRQAAGAVAHTPDHARAVRPLRGANPPVAWPIADRPLGHARGPARGSGGHPAAAVLGVERRAPPALHVDLSPRPGLDPRLPGGARAPPDRLSGRLYLVALRTGAEGAAPRSHPPDYARRHHERGAGAGMAAPDDCRGVLLPGPR